MRSSREQSWQSNVVSNTSKIVFLGGGTLAGILLFASETTSASVLVAIPVILLVGIGWLARLGWKMQTLNLMLASGTICLTTAATLGPRFGALTSGTIAACLAITLLGVRAGILAHIVLLVGLIAIAFAAVGGYLEAPSLAMPRESPIVAWTRAIVSFAVTSGAISSICSAMVRALERNLEKATTLAAERERLIRELESKNSELERFTYTVSHDLKSPIVTIKGFVGMLKQDIATGKMETVQADLKRIEGATDKMAGLLGDLLDLSRAGHAQGPIQTLRMRTTIDSALELLAGSIQERGVTVEVASDIPAVQADPKRIAEVWQNLIENAIKYMGEQTAPRIEIGCIQVDKEYKFYVQDNGIGIDPKYRETVFGHFNQLDPTAEGSGIGLAIVRRIIEGHGGRIWVESPSNGIGSVFYFTLPG